MMPISNPKSMEEDLNPEKKFKVIDAAREFAGGKEGEETEKKETVSEISAAEKETAYKKILSKVKESPHESLSEEVVREDARISFEKNDAEGRIQHLVNLALTKGPVHAVKVAKRLEENYVIDMFHNRMLADELHEALVRKGII